MIEKTLELRVRAEREKLICACYEALGYTHIKTTREGDASIMLKAVFVREEAEPKEVGDRRERCEAVLAEIESIDAKAERYYLERVVLVGMAGAACIGLSFLFLHFGWHIAFTLALLAGLFGCSITLALRPVFIRMGLARFGGELPQLERKLHAILAEQEG